MEPTTVQIAQEASLSTLTRSCGPPGASGAACDRRHLTGADPRPRLVNHHDGGWGTLPMAVLQPGGICCGQ